MSSIGYPITNIDSFEFWPNRTGKDNLDRSISSLSDQLFYPVIPTFNSSNQSKNFGTSSRLKIRPC